MSAWVICTTSAKSRLTAAITQSVELFEQANRRLAEQLGYDPAESQSATPEQIEHTGPGGRKRSKVSELDPGGHHWFSVESHGGRHNTIGEGLMTEGMRIAVRAECVGELQALYDLAAVLARAAATTERDAFAAALERWITILEEGGA